MPLLFCDLDNTLSDRAASFNRWATSYLTERFGAASDEMLAAMIQADGDGLTDKRHAASEFARVLGLNQIEEAEIIKVMRAGTLEHLAPTPGVNEALDRATAAGWRPFVVTNGNVAQQERKVALLGLADHITGMVISEGVGVAKPDPQIFRIAAEQAGGVLDDAWMIGDSLASDIAGGYAAGLNTIWLHRGRELPVAGPQPTIVADSVIEAIDRIIIASAC